MKFLKNNQWYIITAGVCLVIGLIMGLTINHSKIITKPVTNIIQGNVMKVPVYTTITNWQPIYIDFADYSTDSFVNVQTANKLKVQIYKRNETITLKQWQGQDSWFISGILNPLTSEYGAGVSYRVFGPLYGGLQFTERSLTNFSGDLLISIGF